MREELLSKEEGGSSKKKLASLGGAAGGPRGVDRSRRPAEAAPGYRIACGDGIFIGGRS